MAIPRTRLLVRGIVAVFLALLFGGAALTRSAADSADQPGTGIAPVITLYLGSAAFVVLAWSAFTLYIAVGGPAVNKAALHRARQSYRLCVPAVPAIAVAGLGAGAVTAIAYDRPAYLGFAAWAVAVVLLAYLLTLRGQGKSVARATWESEHPGEMG